MVYIGLRLRAALLKVAGHNVIVYGSDDATLKRNGRRIECEARGCGIQQRAMVRRKIKKRKVSTQYEATSG